MAAVIRIDILGDSRSAQRSARDAERGYDRLGRGADRSSRKVGRFGTALSTAARRYGPLAAAVGAGAVLKLGTDSIRAASDVQQSFGAVDAVFGKHARAVKRWAKSAADDLGLAKAEYAQLATVTGSMLKNSGLTDYTRKTRDLLKLGGDLAAQYGGSTKQAVEAIGSLMRGETDPIEKYGVSIKQSTIEAYLHAKGLDDLKGKQRTQAEQQARLALLFGQTKDAQGAFRRESDTLAQSQQKLGARWENLKATLGERLLPVAARFVTWLGKTIEGSNGTGKGLRKLGETIGSFVGPIIDGARRGWQRFNEKLDAATGHSDSLKKGFMKIVEWAEKVAPKVGRWLGKKIETLGSVMGDAAIFASKVWKALKEIARWAGLAWEPIDRLAGAIGRLDLNKVGKIGGGGILGLASAGLGALRSGSTLPGGLGRAGGFGSFAAGGGGVVLRPTFSPQIHLSVNHHALANFIRMEIRNEISQQVAAAKRHR